MKTQRKTILFFFSLLILLPQIGTSQVLEPKPNTDYYLIHSSGNVVVNNSENRAAIQTLSGTDDQLLEFVPDGTGYYWIKPKGVNRYMALNGSWNTYFVTDSTTNNSKYTIEQLSSSYVLIKCKANSKYLGTDNTTSGSYIYSDKDGTDSKHYWYISEKYGPAPVESQYYLINPNATYTNTFEGWGVSLCWWANMTGKWDDDKIDEIVDWLVSPDGLNFNIFRYNIGGGDNPLNSNCTAHHMANGKGIRAEMEGFKDSTNADYDWSRDAAQRKIMLKIKEKRPDAIFEAFSNSAPYYMTYSGCCAGNVNATDDNLKPEYYEEFAHYLVDVCKYYKDSLNIEFKTLEPFNEPVTNYWYANGSQEGCHFSASAQVNFLKVLSPILSESGLNTIISASDETSTSQSVTTLNTYISDGEVLDLVGQWNTHTYSADNNSRANLRALSTAYNKTLWMSEVGAGGTGISGNLNLAQKLIQDIKYIRPEAWLDWQYVEENNDQWCLVKGDFNAQTYERVKNFYVRQQFTRYIKVGSKFLSVPNDKMLAALNPTSDSLTIVLLNNSSSEAVHYIDLNMFDEIGSLVLATRTSETEDNAIISNFALTDTSLIVTLPGYSTTTFVIPVLFTSTENKVETDTPYLIQPRTGSLMMESNNNAVAIKSFQFADSTQMWVLKESGDGYSIKNLAGEFLTDNGSYYLATSTTEDASTQIFQLESVDDDCYKIISASTGKALDLEGESNSSGTSVGLYAYGTTPAASHRQWIFSLPPFKGSNDIVNNIDDSNKSITIDEYVLGNAYPNPFNASTNIKYTIPQRSHVQIVVYDLMGRKVKTLVDDWRNPGNFTIHFNAGNLSSGIYFYRMISNQNIITKKFLLLK